MVRTLHAFVSATVMVLFALSGPAVAQTAPPAPHGGAHSGHGAGHGSGHAATPANGPESEAARAFAAANARMHAGMDIAYTGDADVDFVKGMIAHHRGAVDMARIVLEHGKDPEIKKLANDIIKAQESEISMMQDWLKKRGQ